MWPLSCYLCGREEKKKKTKKKKEFESKMRIILPKQFKMGIFFFVSVQKWLYQNFMDIKLNFFHIWVLNENSFKT